MLLYSLVTLLLAIALFYYGQQFKDDVMHLASVLFALLLFLGGLILTPWPLKSSILCAMLLRLYWVQDRGMT